MVPYVIGEKEDFRDTISMRAILPKELWPWFLSELALNDSENIALMNFHFMPLEEAKNYVLGKSRIDHEGYEGLKKLANKMTVEEPDQNSLDPRPPLLEIIRRVPGTSTGIIEMHVLDKESAQRYDTSPSHSHSEYKWRKKRKFFHEASPRELYTYQKLAGLSIYDGLNGKFAVANMRLPSVLPDNDRTQAAIYLTAALRRDFKQL